MIFQDSKIAHSTAVYTAWILRFRLNSTNSTIEPICLGGEKGKKKPGRKQEQQYMVDKLIFPLKIAGNQFFNKNVTKLERSGPLLHIFNDNMMPLRYKNY